MFWEQLSCSNEKASTFSLSSLERAGHSATAVGEYIYVIGGRRGSRFYHDLLRFNTLTCAWERVFPQLPFAARANHSAILVGSSIWVFGGADAKQVLSDCWVLDINTHNWSQASLGGRATLLGRCAAGVDMHPKNQQVVLVFGGYGAAGEGSETFDYFNDVLAIDTVRRRVDVLPPIGKAPNPRCFHTFTTLGDRCYVIGGRRMDQGAMRGRNMVAVFDVSAKAWLDAQVTGIAVPPRSSHKAVALGGDRLLVVGGSVELTPAGGASGQSETQGAPPAPQGGSGLLVELIVAPAPTRVAAPSKAASKESPAARFAWSEVDDSSAGGAGQQLAAGESPATPRPTLRAGHACCIIGTRLYVIGGFMTETKNYLPEVWALELSSSTAPSAITGHSKAGQLGTAEGAGNQQISVVTSAAALALAVPRPPPGEGTQSRKRSRSRSPKGLAQVLGGGQTQGPGTGGPGGQQQQGREAGSLPAPGNEGPQWMTTRRGGAGRASSKEPNPPAGPPPVAVAPAAVAATGASLAPVGAVISASSVALHPAAAMHPVPAAVSDLQGQQGLLAQPSAAPGADLTSLRIVPGSPSLPSVPSVPAPSNSGPPASPVHTSPGRASPTREVSLAEVQQVHQQQVEQLTSYYMQQVNALQAEVARLRGELVRTSSSEANAGVRASSAEAEVGALRSELTSLRSTLQHRAAELQALQQEKKELQAQMNLSISQQQALMTERQKLQDERQALVTHGAQAQARARELEGALYAAQTEAEASRVAAQREVEAATRRIKELQDELESSRQSLRNIQDSFARVTDQNNRNMDANNKLTRSLQEAQEKVQEVQRKWSEDVERQRAALDAERAAGAAAVGQLRDERNRAAGLETELNKARAEGASLKQQVTTLTDQVSRTQAEAQAAQAEVADLRQRLDRITQLESDNGADERLLQEVLSRMRGRRAVLDQEAAGLRARYASGSAGQQLPQLQQHNSMPQQQLQPQVSGGAQGQQQPQQQVPAVQYPQQYHHNYAPSTSYNPHGAQQNTMHR